jgi:hypothetical protein
LLLKLGAPHANHRVFPRSKFDGGLERKRGRKHEAVVVVGVLSD